MIHIDYQVTTRYVDLQPVGMGTLAASLDLHHTRSFTNRQGPSVSSGAIHPYTLARAHLSCVFTSSAKDQLTGSSVAIKKIMKPFSTPVLSKRTYRELKLLKHIQHENVGLLATSHVLRTLT